MADVKTVGHTPVPWGHKLAKIPSDGEYDCAISAVIDGRTYCIGEMVGRCAIAVKLPAEANAAFIVKACNAHDDLVKALESFLLPTPINDEMLTFAWKAYNAATTGEPREALAKAGAA